MGLTKIGFNDGDVSKPLSAARLNQLETNVDSELATKSNVGHGHVIADVSGLQAALNAAGGGTPTITSPGNLGTARSLSYVSPESWLVGTLNANLTVTFTGLAAGARYRLFLTQDATGNRTLTISDGTNSRAIAITTAPTATTEVEAWYDGTDLFVNVEALRSTATALNARDFGAVGDAQIDNLAAATDDTAAIQAAMNAAAAIGIPLFIPPGQPIPPFATSGYKITSGLLFQGTNTMLEGCGNAGQLMFNTTQVQEYTWLTIKGPGEAAGYGGYCRDLVLNAYTVHARGASTSTAKIGFCLHERILFEATNVVVNNAAIAFEMEENCFGTIWTKCSNTSYGSRVGMNVNSGAGNDVKFYDCWLTGDEAAVYISGNNSGFAFRDGQLAAGHGSSSDDTNAGVVVMGKDYRTGTVGGDITNVTFEGFDVESFPHRYFLRTYSQVQVSIRDSLFLSYGGDAIGIWYGTNTNSSRVTWQSNTAVGTYTHTTAFEFGGTAGTFIAIDESNTLNNATWNGVGAADYAGRSFLVHSQMNRGRAYLGGGVELLGGLLLRHNEGTNAFEKSTNWGSSWSLV